MNYMNKQEAVTFTVRETGQKVKFGSKHWIDLIRNNPETYGNIFVECEDDRDKLIRERDEEIRNLKKRISELEKK